MLMGIAKLTVDVLPAYSSENNNRPLNPATNEYFMRFRGLNFISFPIPIQISCESLRTFAKMVLSFALEAVLLFGT
jgi:hypothetical protein